MPWNAFPFPSPNRKMARLAKPQCGNLQDQSATCFRRACLTGLETLNRDVLLLS